MNEFRDIYELKAKDMGTHIQPHYTTAVSKQILCRPRDSLSEGDFSSFPDARQARQERNLRAPAFLCCVSYQH